MKKVTRVMSIILTIMMLFTVLPTNVWAAKLKAKDIRLFGRMCG